MMNKQTIFITGAAAGIGRETALLFAKNGWFVGIADVDLEGLASLQSQIGRDACFPCQMDVVDRASVEKAINAFAAKTKGGMDVLLNNAGILRMGWHDHIDLTDQKSIVDINITGGLNCIHYALDCLKRTSGARIINMGSAASLYGIPQLAVYSATKHAVRALTEALNMEFRRYDIFVSDVWPPYVKTKMVLDSACKAYSVEKFGANLEPQGTL